MLDAPRSVEDFQRWAWSVVLFWDERSVSKAGKRDEEYRRLLGSMIDILRGVKMQDLDQESVQYKVVMEHFGLYGTHLANGPLV